MTWQFQAVGERFEIQKRSLFSRGAHIGEVKSLDQDPVTDLFRGYRYWLAVILDTAHRPRVLEVVRHCNGLSGAAYWAFVDGDLVAEQKTSGRVSPSVNWTQREHAEQMFRWAVISVAVASIAILIAVGWLQFSGNQSYLGEVDRGLRVANAASSIVVAQWWNIRRMTRAHQRKLLAAEVAA